MDTTAYSLHAFNKSPDPGCGHTTTPTRQCLQQESTQLSSMQKSLMVYAPGQPCCSELQNTIQTCKRSLTVSAGLNCTMATHISTSG